MKTAEKTTRASVLLLILLFAVLPLFAGCHGAKGSKAFEVPESFDETKAREITFWAKNDTNVNQTRI
ncbi:MAG: ABC transporter substrate-binding protein, partial [Lachnospiraceae bacterium]|nr:ABC transporter substrate-binding protein [Lachnospiraceae bacterium]